jgi:hypothetical protein
VKPIFSRRFFAFVVFAGVGAASASYAAPFEDPPVEDAASLLGALANGPNYSVDAKVQSDGLMRIYLVHSRVGNFEVVGDGLLRQRLRELQALQSLQAMSQSKVFLDSLGKAAAAPLKFGADLVSDPAGTMQKTFSGVANMFDRVGSGLANNNRDSRSDVASSVLGVDAAKRALAVQLGVDPYTDFEPLAATLGDVARTAALGGLTLKGLTLAIPGGIGMAVSSTSTADMMRSTLAEKTPSQIVDLVTARLRQLNVPAAEISRFVQNRFYTPADLLSITNSLSALKLRGSRLFVSRAGEADGRDVAVFQRGRAELLAKNASAFGIGDFVDVGGFPLNQSQDGRLVALFPLDEVAWTEAVAGAANNLTAAAKAAGHDAVLSLITGVITQRAQNELAQLGWTVQKLP